MFCKCLRRSQIFDFSFLSGHCSFFCSHTWAHTVFVDAVCKKQVHMLRSGSKRTHPQGFLFWPSAKRQQTFGIDSVLPSSQPKASNPKRCRGEFKQPGNISKRRKVSECEERQVRPLFFSMAEVQNILEAALSQQKQRLTREFEKKLQRSLDELQSSFFSRKTECPSYIK